MLACSVLGEPLLVVAVAANTSVLYTPDGLDPSTDLDGSVVQYPKPIVTVSAQGSSIWASSTPASLHTCPGYIASAYVLMSNAVLPSIPDTMAIKSCMPMWLQGCPSESVPRSLAICTNAFKEYPSVSMQFIGTIHGDETAQLLVMMRWAEELCLAAVRTSGTNVTNPIHRASGNGAVLAGVDSGSSSSKGREDATAPPEDLERLLNLIHITRLFVLPLFNPDG